MLLGVGVVRIGIDTTFQDMNKSEPCWGVSYVCCLQYNSGQHLGDRIESHWAAGFPDTPAHNVMRHTPAHIMMPMMLFTTRHGTLPEQRQSEILPLPSLPL